MSIRVEDFDNIDFSDIATGERMAPVHPGEILLDEFLEPMEISQNRIARDIGVPPRRINEIVLGKRSLTADTALRLGAYFSMSPQFWVNLQSSYDLAAANAALGDRLREEVKAFA